MKDHPLYSFFLLLFLCIDFSFGGPLYDHTAYSECKSNPEKPLYGGGIVNPAQISGNTINCPSYSFKNLTDNTIYSLSSWVTITGADSAIVKAVFNTANHTHTTLGTVTAKPGCWSFLKGGFVLNSTQFSPTLAFQNPDGRFLNITIASTSLQPFSEQEWRLSQERVINTTRRRSAIVHVVNEHGDNVPGADIRIEQLSQEFLLGSSIARNILGNLPYQKWFAERFNAASFESELKWNATEPEQGKVNYTTTDQILEYLRSHQISVRGHNVLWELPKYVPPWAQNLTSPDLMRAVQSRIQSVMTKYKNEFINWDVNNEMLHNQFYEFKLGPNISWEFFKIAHETDPLATLFMNEFNVVEIVDDLNSTVDTYISRLRELQNSGVSMGGIGLESHFYQPNPPLIRAYLDKLATLELPIWFTELDISKTIDIQTQGKYLELVLREGYSHPAVSGIILWAVLYPGGCFQMCLTDNNFRNLPAGEVVDRLLKEWQTGVVEGKTDDYGSISFNGFLGEYKVSVTYGNKTTTSKLTLCRGDETKHVSVLV